MSEKGVKTPFGNIYDMRKMKKFIRKKPGRIGLPRT